MLAHHLTEIRRSEGLCSSVEASIFKCLHKSAALRGNTHCYYYCKFNCSGRCHGCRRPFTAAREYEVLLLWSCCNGDSTLVLIYATAVIYVETSTIKCAEGKQDYRCCCSIVLCVLSKTFNAICTVTIVSVAPVSRKNMSVITQRATGDWCGDVACRLHPRRSHMRLSTRNAQYVKQSKNFWTFGVTFVRL